MLHKTGFSPVKTVISVCQLLLYINPDNMIVLIMFYFFLPRAEHYESREARQTSGTGPDRWKGIVCYYFYFFFFLGMLIDIYSHYYSNNVSSCYMSSVEMCPVACSVVAHFKECDGIQHLSALSS